jgi:hypothetical protein
MYARVLLALGLALLPVAAVAAPSPSPSPEPAAGAHDGGTIDGRVTAVNYQRGVVGVDAGTRGRIDVGVMPSTTIQGTDSAYHALSDLKAGQRVQILSSVAGGKYVAQIIRILP